MKKSFRLFNHVEVFEFDEALNEGQSADPIEIGTVDSDKIFQIK